MVHLGIAPVGHGGTEARGYGEGQASRSVGLGTRLRATILGGAICVSLVAAGCGPRQQRIDAALAGAREPLTKVALCLGNAVAVLPTEEDVQAGCFAKGIPPLVADLRPNTSNPGSLDLMMVEDVRTPWGPTASQHPVARSSRLAEPMGWVLGGQAVPADLSARGVKGRLDVALAVRYVLLFKVTEYKDPIALSVSEFSGGSVSGTFYLVDLCASKVLCMLPFIAKNGENLLYLKVQGRDDAEKLERFQKVLRENMFEAARKDAFGRIETLIPGSRILRY